jgi:hypothetical protein
LTNRTPVLVDASGFKPDWEPFPRTFLKTLVTRSPVSVFNTVIRLLAAYPILIASSRLENPIWHCTRNGVVCIPLRGDITQHRDCNSYPSHYCARNFHGFVAL